MERHNGIEPDPEGAFVYYADAQATVEALQAQLKDMVLRNKILRDRLDLPPERCAFHDEVVSLQARVQELEEWKQIVIGADSRQDLIYQLSDQLTQRTAECDALKLVNDTHMKTVMKLSHVVEQRTAEIEAANKLLYKKNCELGRFETIISDLHAELERVRGEHNKAGEKLQREVNTLNHLLRNVGLGQGEIDGMAADIEELTTLRTLIAALPAYKDVSVFHRINENDYGSWHVWVDHNPLAECDTEEEANAIKALYEHRQGMEG